MMKMVSKKLLSLLTILALVAMLLPGAAGGIEGGNIAGGALCLAAGLLLTFFGMAGLRGESVGE